MQIAQTEMRVVDRQGKLLQLTVQLKRALPLPRQVRVQFWAVPLWVQVQLVRPPVQKGPWAPLVTAVTTRLLSQLLLQPLLPCRKVPCGI